MTRPGDEDREYERRIAECEAREQRRELRRSYRCQCGDDLPGVCLGPTSCPYSDFNSSDEEDEQQ